MFVSKVAVIGAGTMGADIAHVVASAGIDVVLEDPDRDAVRRGLERARALWDMQVESGKLEAAALEGLAARMQGASDLDGLGEVDLVIEAVPERLELKSAVFSELDEATPGHAILASNTSALPITELAEATGRPDRVVGLHFFFPASRMRAVEVVEGEHTSSETLQAATSFVQAIRKLPIRCTDEPGFVVNRIMTAAFAELWRAQEESGVPEHELDELIAETGAAPIGPYRLADLIGLDTVLHVVEYLHDSLGERFFVPARLRELVADGRLGAKTGRGFYEH